jgi:hypothetical protein
MDFFIIYNHDLSSGPCHLRFFDSININTNNHVTLYGLIDISNSNVHLLFYITSGTSTPTHLLTLLRCMVHRSQVLVDHSSITIMIHMFLHVFNKLMLVTLCYVDLDEYIFMS